MTETSPHTGLAEFREVIADYRSVGPWAIAGTVSVPLVDYLLQIGPPWPTGINIITSIAELLVLLAVFHFSFGSDYKHVSRRIIILLVVLVVCFGAYLYLNSAYTYTAGASSQKFVKGFVPRPDIAPLLTADYTADDALGSNEYRAEAVWTTASITAMRLFLLALWLASFIVLSATIATFVIYHRRRAVP